MFSKLVFNVNGKKIEFHSHELVRIAIALLGNTTGNVVAIPDLNFYNDFFERVQYFGFRDLLLNQFDIDLLKRVLLLPIHFKEINTLPKWLFLAKHLASTYEDNTQVGWWILLSGRLILVKNESARKRFFISDHGFISDIYREVKEVVFSIPWGLNKELLDKIAKSTREQGNLAEDAVKEMKENYLRSISQITLEELQEWHLDKSTDELNDIKNKLKTDPEYREKEWNRLEETLRYLTNIVSERFDALLSEDMSDFYDHIVEKYGRTVISDFYIKTIVLSGIAKAVNRGNFRSLFRPFYCYGAGENGSSYNDFAKSFDDYLSLPNTLSSKQLAGKIRGILKGELINSDDINFLPNLAGAWFIAETARNPVSLLSGLMLLDMIEEGVDLIDDDGNNLYSWQHVLRHPKKPNDSREKVFIKDLYGGDIELAKFDGTHPMAHADSVPHSRTKLSKGEKLSPVRQKEGSLIIHWLYIKTKQEYPGIDIHAETVQSSLLIYEKGKSPCYREIDMLFAAKDNPSKSIKNDKLLSEKWNILHKIIIPQLERRLGSLENLFILGKIGEKPDSIHISIEDKIEISSSFDLSSRYLDFAASYLEFTSNYLDLPYKYPDIDQSWITEVLIRMKGATAKDHRNRIEEYMKNAGLKMIAEVSVYEKIQLIFKEIGEKFAAFIAESACTKSQQLIQFINALKSLMERLEMQDDILYQAHVNQLALFNRSVDFLCEIVQKFIIDLKILEMFHFLNYPLIRALVEEDGPLFYSEHKQVNSVVPMSTLSTANSEELHKKERIVPSANSNSESKKTPGNQVIAQEHNCDQIKIKNDYFQPAMLYDGKQGKIKQNSFKLFQTSYNQQNTIPTKGEGDCALHAILGKWSNEHQCIEYDDVKGARSKIQQAIEHCVESEVLNPLVNECIRDWITSGNLNENRYPRSRALWKLYEQAVTAQENWAEHWEKFEREINRHADVKQSIVEKNTLPVNSTFRDHFYNVLSQDDDELQGRIASLPALQAAFTEYNRNVNPEFNWEQISQEIRVEFARFISAPHAWVASAELKIIAHIFNVTIEYYPYPGANVEIINSNPDPNYPKVAIQFNGRDHFERVRSPSSISFSGDTILPVEKPSENVQTRSGSAFKVLRVSFSSHFFKEKAEELKAAQQPYPMGLGI